MITYTIGQFAAYGRVSVRMLRRYDAIDLLVPAEIEDRTGYRRYDASQLSTLARIVGLRDLGVSLEEIRSALRDPVDTTDLARDRPALDRLFPALERAGVLPRDPSVIYHTGEGAEMVSDAGEVIVHVGMPATDDDPVGDFADVTLAHVPLAATLVHHGVMARIGDSWMTLSEWVEQNGYRFAGPCREVYLVSEPVP